MGSLRKGDDCRDQLNGALAALDEDEEARGSGLVEVKTRSELYRICSLAEPSEVIKCSAGSEFPAIRTRGLP